MRNLSLIPPSGIPAKLFGKWMGFRDLNDVNEMTELGFVASRPGRKIVLHPMMKDVSVSEFPPSLSACHTLLESIREVCRDHAEEIPYSGMMFQTLENAVDLAEKDDVSFYLSLLEDAFECMERFRYDNGMKRMLKEMGRLLKDESVATPYHRTLLKAFQAKAEGKSKKAVELMKDAVSIMPDIDSEGAELAATVNANLAYLYMREQNTEMIKQHLIATAAIMDKYDLMGTEKAWVQAVSAAVCADGQEEFERRLDALLKLDSLFHKKNDGYTLKALGEGLKAAAYMHMMTGHNEEAARSFQRAMFVYSLVYANDPQSLEHEKKEIANICESRALSGILPLTARV